MPNPKMKPSEWLQEFDSHGIYDATAIAADFTNTTGLEPCWPVHTPKETRAAIRARGLGGSFSSKNENQLMAYGYSIARALESKFVPVGKQMSHGFYGRGSQFRAAIKALQSVGM